MKTITHYQKVMWELYCEYSHLNKKKWSTSYNLYNEDGEFQKTVVNHYERRSNEQWDFINAKFYYVTKIDPIYGGTKKEFADYLEPYILWNGKVKHKASPYEKKETNYASLRRRFSWFGWRKRRYPSRSKWQKRPKHVKKKVLDEKEIAKREWREFKKDRRSQKFHKNYRGVKQQFKHDCARFHRNFEKQCIQREDYDKLHHRTWKQCIDWWSYD